MEVSFVLGIGFSRVFLGFLFLYGLRDGRDGSVGVGSGVILGIRTF